MDLYSIGVALACIVVLIGVFKGWGENRTIVIYRNYDDLGLSFLVPASCVLIVALFNWLGADPRVGFGLGLFVAIALGVILVRQTYHNNEQDVGKTILAVITKLPLAVVWILNMIQLLNPSGKTSQQRRNNRGQAMIILAILTPVIGALVVERDGSYFNPMNWIRGRRVGSGIRDHLR